MNSLTKTLMSIGAAGLVALGSGCDSEVKQTGKKDYNLDQVFLTSQGDVWAARIDENGQIIKEDCGYINREPGSGVPLVTLHKVLPTGEKPIYRKYFYNNKQFSSYREILLPKDFEFKTSSERIQQGKTSIEIDVEAIE